MKLSQRLKEQAEFVQKKLANTIICDRCGTSLADYADKCSAELCDPCPGFMLIEEAKAEFDSSVRTPGAR